MTRDDTAPDGATRSGGINRRRVLATIGAGAAGLTIATGSASAHQFKFYGCSQVCTESDGNRAVVTTGDGYECRPLDRYDSDQTSQRQNQDWWWRSACYEVQGDESIVGVVETPEDGPPTVCLNPNNCATNYLSGDSDEDVAEALNAIGCTSGTIETGSCNLSGVGGGNGKGGGKSSGTDGPPEHAGPPEDGGGPPDDHGASADGGNPGQGKSKGHGKGK